jgi:DNA polymerase III epsilon subunit-like protein
MDLFRGQRVCVLDTETTGFPGQEWSHVIELGAVILDSEGREVASFGELVTPPILDERAEPALAINHITAEELRRVGRSPATVAREFADWLWRHECRFVAAYNRQFDEAMLRKMAGWSEVDVRWLSCIMLASMGVMASAGAAERFSKHGRAKWPKLSASAEFFGVVPDGQAHRAETDARTAAGVMAAIARRRRAAEAAAMPARESA